MSNLQTQAPHAPASVIDTTTLISETYRTAGETEYEWLSRLAIRDHVRRALWASDWTVTELS